MADTSFSPELKEFVLSELEDMGAEWVWSGLLAVLMVESGEMVSHGTNQEARDGNAAAALATADIIAHVFGQSPAEFDADIAAALEPLQEELLEIEGLADLADQVMALLADPKTQQFEEVKGIHANQVDFQAQVARVAQRVTLAKLQNPTPWEYEPLGEGVFEIEMYDQTPDGEGQ